MGALEAGQRHHDDARGTHQVVYEPFIGLDAGDHPLDGGGDSRVCDLQELVEREGDAWFSFTVLNGQVALRVNVENRSMEQSDIERLVQVIRRAADRILES